MLLTYIIKLFSYKRDFFVEDYLDIKVNLSKNLNLLF